MTRRLIRCITAACALGVLLIGVPVLLAHFGSSLPHHLPTGAQLRDVPGQALSDDAVFGILTVLAWLAWCAFTLAVAADLIAELRGSAHPKLPIPRPLRAASYTLVAALLMTVSVAGPLAARAVAAPPLVRAMPPTRAPTTTVQSRPPAPVTTPAPATTPVVAGRSIIVAPGDSPWSLAEKHLGAGIRWRKMWDLNRGTVQADGQAWVVEDQIQVGWTLRLPDDATNAPAPAPAAAPAPSTYVVQPGDTLSQIASTQLGDPARAQDLFAANATRPQPDGRQLSDPNFILPGWSLELPTASPAPATVPAHPADPASEAHDAPGYGSITAPPSTTAAPPRATSPATSAPPSSPSTTPSVTTVPEPASSSAPAMPPAAKVPAPARPHTSTPTKAEARHPMSSAVRPRGRTGAGRMDGHDEAMLPARAPFLAGITGATVLATGLGLFLTRQRRRRATTGARHGRGPVDLLDAATQRALVSASDLPLVRWAGQELARMAAALDPKFITGTPVAVELSDTSGIELLWDIPQTAAPEPWQATDGGWAWRLPYDPDAPIPPDELPSPIPALVTFGERDGRQLLVNLEAIGSLAVTGDDDAVDAFIRSITTELATSDDLADAYLLLSGVDLDTPGDQGRTRTVGPADLQAEFTSVARAAADVIGTKAGSGSSFAFRSGPRGGRLEAHVAVIDARNVALPSGLLDLAEPHHGVAAIVAGDVEAAAQLHIGANGMARLDLLGIDFCAVGLPEATADRLRRLFESGTTIKQEAADDDGLDGRVVDLSVLASPDIASTCTLTNGHSLTPLDGRTSVVLPSPTSKPEKPSEEAPPIVTSAERHGLDNASETQPPGEGQGPPPPQLLIRVLGAPHVPDRPDLIRRELVVTVFLACRGGSVPASSVQDAVWNGRAVQDKTLWNLIARTRSALGTFEDGTPVMPQADRQTNTLHLSDGVRTDCDLLRAAYKKSLTASPDQALTELSSALDLIEGPPFDAVGYDWAHHTYQLVAEASDLIERAAERVVALAEDAGDIETARHALVQGLRGLPGNEVLYRLRMTLEHQAGNLAAVKGAYVELLGFLADLDTDPSDATVNLYQRLTAASRIWRVQGVTATP